MGGLLVTVSGKRCPRDPERLPKRTYEVNQGRTLVRMDDDGDSECLAREGRRPNGGTVRTRAVAVVSGRKECAWDKYAAPQGATARDLRSPQRVDGSGRGGGPGAPGCVYTPRSQAPSTYAAAAPRAQRAKVNRGGSGIATSVRLLYARSIGLLVSLRGELFLHGSPVCSRKLCRARTPGPCLPEHNSPIFTRQAQQMVRAEAMIPSTPSIRVQSTHTPCGRTRCLTRRSPGRNVH